MAPFFHGDSVPNNLAGKRSNGLTNGPLWACAAFWMGSYLVPLYFLPITLFAALWLAVIVWGLVLCSPAANAQRMNFVPLDRIHLWLPAVGLVCLAIAAHALPGDALVLLTASSVFVFGLYCEDPRWLRCLIASIIAAAFVSVFLALIQLVYPNADFVLVAPLAHATQATANLRQPNLFAQLLLLASVGTMLFALPSKAPYRWISHLACLVLGSGLAFSQSRTGLLGLLILVIWSRIDSGLPKSTRRIPLLIALGCGLAMAGMSIAAHLSGTATHIEVQQAGGGDISSSRFGIWRNTLSLIGMYPLTGVGWGNFAQAWALTPFPNRPGAAFDNAHNLPLQLMVELGIPLALVVMGLFIVPLWRARHATLKEYLGDDAIKARCLFVMLGLLGMHSLLEYPLWFNFFLLPAAFFLGQLIQLGSRAERSMRGRDGSPVPAEAISGGRRLLPGLLQGLGMVIVLGSLYAVWDYSRVLQVFRPFGEGIFVPLGERIAEGRKSRLFGYWVDYAAVTNATFYKGLDVEMNRAFHGRMNPHMLLVYAKYLNELGEKDKAAYVAERLKEFKHPIAAEFFAECKDDKKRETAFQCAPPKKAYTFKDFG